MKKIINLIKKVFEKYPVTYISSILTSLVYVIFFEYSQNLFDMLCSFLVPLGITSFLIETLNKKTKKYYIIPIIIGLFLSIITRYNVIINSNLFTRTIIFYYVSLIFLSIYFNYKNIKKSLSKYLMSTFSSLLEMGIIYAILNVGLILILIIIDYLLIGGVLSDLIDKVLVLLIGLFLIPSTIYSISNYKEINKFINILVTKIITSIILITYIVIYIYIFKIIITLKIPSNIIFRITSILFFISSIISVMNKDYENNKYLILINKIIPFIFIPLIILQIYSLGIRICSYGLTMMRYIGIMIIILEIIYTIFNLTKKDLSQVIFIVIIELFISLIIPYINAYELPINMHYNNLLKYKSNKKINNSIYSSYQYLNKYELGIERIDKVLSDNDKIIFNNYTINYDQYYNYYKEDSIFNIEGYKSLYEVFEYNETKYPIILDKVNKCINGNTYECFENNNTILLDDKKIIIKVANITYKNKEIKYYDLNYYILKK